MLIKFHNHEMTLSGIGKNLGSVLINAGIPIDLRCSGKGTCDRCKVNLLKGKFSVDDQEIEVQDKPVKAKAKACQTITLCEDSIIEIPRKSLAGSNPKCAESFDLGKFKLSSEYSGIAAVID
ncbi:MAG: 2Fe-2S iron-sulfur cluster binding domain-containing protein, partial [Victivallales bacterium]|nr:2Fe-2S iron-sulfur cluster binding domain-containing protein [Victivallales bacterium]